MLHTETVEAGTLALIKRLSGDPVLKNFVLVGGRALSLQLGHRKSIDIDLFSPVAFDAKVLGDHLNTQYKGERIQVLTNGVFSLTAKYPGYNAAKGEKAISQQKSYFSSYFT